MFFYMFPHLGVCLKGFLFVSPIIGCTGRSILHCEASIFLIVSRASHCLCTHSMASATSASFPGWPPEHETPLTRSMPMGSTSRAGPESGKPVASRSTKPLLFPLGFLITDTAMSICCAPHTCSGQAGVPGNGAQRSVEATFKLAAEPARMVLTVRAVVWWVVLLIPSPQSRAGSPESGHTRCSANTRCSTNSEYSANTRCSANTRWCESHKFLWLIRMSRGNIERSK